MPTYNYKCNFCNYEFEIYQNFSDKIKRKCPECSKISLERLIGKGSGIIFKKGCGGFYSKDYPKS